MEVARAVEVLADLQRRGEVGGEAGIAVEIVVDHRLIDPGEAVAVDGVAAGEGVGLVQALVEVDHEGDVAPDRRAHRVQRRQIVGQPLAPEPELEPGEAALPA